MKKINLKGKLNLGKETISKLNNEQMSAIIGGTVGMSNCVGCPSVNPPTEASCDCTVTQCASNCPGSCGC